MIVTDKIKSAAEEILAGGPFFVVDVVIHPGNRIQVFIDGDHDVSIADCRELSRKIESGLDRDTEDFELTVSSAGIDRPLKFSRQYRKNIGRILSVVTSAGEVCKGTLVRADETEIEIGYPVKNPKKEKQRENTILRYEAIRTAKVEVAFK